MYIWYHTFKFLLMDLTQILLLSLIILLIINIILTLKGKVDNTFEEFSSIKNQITQQARETEKSFRDEFRLNREETQLTSKELREEVGKQWQNFTRTFTEQLQWLIRNTDEKLNQFRIENETSHKINRKELGDAFLAFRNDVQVSLEQFGSQLRRNFADFKEMQNQQAMVVNEKLTELRSTLEKSIQHLQEGNEKKLEEMRRTVDEKLQETLDKRLAHSFELVSKNLESVQKGLGEMQQLAIGVGDLKRVLSNVKTRGTMGEIQLGNILEQLLAPEQYEVNAITKPGSNNRVEFAIRIPQQNPDHKFIRMPVDSKFPVEDYYKLTDAYENNQPGAAEIAGKALENAIKKAAKDIRDKYLNPPDTTDIGILFLPVEGLYAEAVRRPALLETLRSDYQIIVAGPTTLSAILHTISFAYKTMALEQRSGEIKKTLSAVRTEFGKFGDVLKKAQEKINKASEDIDELVGARTKKINAKLKSFDELPANEAGLLLDQLPDEEL